MDNIRNNSGKGAVNAGESGGSSSTAITVVRNQNNPIPSLVSYMECPVCFDISLPILQCSNGHIICQECWESLTAKTCPTCRILIGEPTRNRALEQIIQSYDAELACKFAVNGCNERMVFPQKEAHQAICPFKNFECPLSASGCKWTGKLTDIVEHLKGRKRSSHAVPILSGDSATFFFAVDPDIEGETHVAVQIQTCLDSFFLIVFRTTILDNDSEGNRGFDNGGRVEYSALVQYLGMKEDAKEFAYRMELERDGRRFSWEAVPLSISESVKRSMDKGDCLNFNFKTMLLFRNEETDMLPIDVTINKV